MRILGLVSVFLCASVGAAHAQFTDLQPGRNFALPVTDLGANRSEDVDLGDVDNDGDLDVVIANGGDFGNEPNRIFINNGGLQGGATGTFTEETATRFAGVPDDTSRDIDFADIDGDGDLDVFVTNRGKNVAGQVDRFYVNQGGLQGGTVGFFLEDTNVRWGTLASVPAYDQVFGGNVGPWEDWSCDCEFADLDNDGDQDLYHSSYGPSFNASRPARIFLNDGAGVFDELFPWVNATADITLQTIDVKLADLDGDFDVDVINVARDTQSRIYINNLYEPLEGSTAPFTDTTATSIFSTGSQVSFPATYGAEVGDLDEDGDFDLWMVNYDAFVDKILVNQGTDVDGVVLFLESDFPGPNWIVADAAVDEFEVDLLDFDGDGDLDAQYANFSGRNDLYVSGLAQGFVQHHNSSGEGNSLYPQIETPVSSNGGTSRDGANGDLDGDGDVDYVLANDGNQDNARWENVLGIPDTHAPAIADEHIAVGLASADAGLVVVNVSVRDNASADLIRFYDVELVYQPGSVSIPMVSQGAQLFRAAMPVGPSSFFIEAIDLAGNVGHSGVQVLDSAFTDLGCADAGITGDPLFGGAGTLEGASAGTLQLSNAASTAPTALFLSIGPSGAGAPFKGGTLKAVPILSSFSLMTDASGAVAIPFVTPAGLGGVSVVGQWAVSDGAASANTSLSNALQLDFP